MEHDWYTLDELARQLGRDSREILKLANRGRIPGRKMGDDWQFHTSEITQWLEQEMHAYTDRELAILESTHRSEDEDVDADVPVSSLLTLDTIEVPLQARTRVSVLESLVELAGRTYQIWEPASVLKAVREREETFSTAVENGVAFPHPRNPLPESIGEPLIAYGRTFTGIPFGAPKRQMTDLFFLILCRDSRTHLQVLARLGRILQLPGLLEELRQADDARSSYDVICKADNQVSETEVE
ncbi:PTS system fructose-specific EIIABC component [Polystyrenella longa]|uniref:PTS system fructose-specific EIIABC component n=1 Tax=Polystyrenella longa TaxID=2528007 RepID=A0A518CL85_9PLAN|nr:PTS sugar transporter subunit IIA [Polystyrenella longa]QDU79981.1 PTS system fructose-specific EIIABC component [Polystyrenella longa]